METIRVGAGIICVVCAIVFAITLAGMVEDGIGSDNMTLPLVVFTVLHINEVGRINILIASLLVGSGAGYFTFGQS